MLSNSDSISTIISSPVYLRCPTSNTRSHNLVCHPAKYMDRQYLSQSQI